MTTKPVTAIELAAHLSVAEDAQGLDAALDAAYGEVATLLGARTIGKTTGNTHTVVTSREKAIFEVPIGPITNVQGITRDGEADDLTKWDQTHPWMVVREPPVDRGVTVIITYDSGWDERTLPDAVRSAILSIAASRFTRPDVTLESVREARVTTRFQTGVLQDHVFSLIAPWQRPYG